MSEQAPPRPPDRDAEPALHPLVPPGVFLVLTLVFTFPLWTDPDGLFINGLFQWSQLWGSFLVDESIRHSGVLPLYTDFLNFPRGGTVVLIGWSCHLLTFLLGLVLPLTAAFNIAVLVHLWAAPYVAFLFCRRVCGSDLASLAGGALFGFSAFVVDALHKGQIDQYSHVWIPAFLLALLYSLETLSARRLGLLGVVSLGLLFSNPYGALFCSLMAPALTLRWLVRSRSPGWPARLAASAAVSLAPASLAYWYFDQLPSSLLQAPLVRNAGDQVEVASLSIARFGGQDVILAGFHLDKCPVVYVGLMALLVALVALVDRRHRRQTAFWWGSWLVVLSLALGNIVPTSSGDFKMPLWYLAKLLPFMGTIQFTDRFVVLAYLLLGVLATYGLQTLLPHVRPGARLPLVAALVALITLDQAQPGGREMQPTREGLILPVTEVHTPRVYADMAAEGGQGAVLELPCLRNLGFSTTDHVEGDPEEYFWLSQKQMFYQATHRRRLANVDKDNLRAAVAFRNPAIRMLVTACMSGHGCGPSTRERAGAARLAAQGFSDVIVHMRSLPVNARAATRNYLDSLFSLRKRYPDDGVLRYTISASRGREGLTPAAPAPAP